MKRNLYILLAATLLAIACAPSQIMKTSLRITVLDELGNTVEGATILLYANEKDYHASQNPVKPAVQTNNKGIATVKGLEAKTYYLDVQKGDKNNVDAGVQTNTLEANRINKINVIIE
jgi:hypothetical protein